MPNQGPHGPDCPACRGTQYISVREEPDGDVEPWGCDFPYWRWKDEGARSDSPLV